MPVDKYWSNYRLETKEGGDLTLNSDQQFNVYSSADSSIEISSGDFTLEAPDGNLTIGIENTGSYSDKELKLQAHGGSLRMHYHVGCRFAYTGYSHYFTASNQNEEGYRFTYAHNDEDTEYAFIITRNDGNAPKFIMDNNGKIEYEGTFRLSGSGGPGDGKFLVSDAQGDATWQDFHNVVDLGHLENIDYSDGGTIEINSGHFIIDATNVMDPSEPTLDGFTEIKSAASVRLAYQGSDGESTYLWLQDDYQCKVQGPGNSMTEGLLLVECRSDSPQHIGVEVELSQFAEPGSRWMDFQDWDNNSKGCIQMAGVILPGTTGSELYAWPSETPSGWVYADYDSSGNDSYTLEGNARFISGNADFGEFFEAGDIEEWPERAEISSKSPLDRASLLGIAEGLVVWVRGRKFYKNMMDNNCIPMFVTKRSIVTGDGSTLLGGSTREIFGEVLSFCGKLPVFVKGAASCGDYLVPAEGKNYCYAVSYDDISFQEYKKAMGRALESCEEMKVLREDHPHAPGEETAFSIILCAVGIK